MGGNLGYFAPAQIPVVKCICRHIGLYGKRLYWGVVTGEDQGFSRGGRVGIDYCYTYDQLRRQYEVEYQPKYQAGYQPATRVDTIQSGPFKVGLILIISLHKYLVEKYVIMHKIDRCYLTRLLCFDWLKCCITLQCDTALVIILSVLALH